jgi:CIC family chloride channel protein
VGGVMRSPLTGVVFSLELTHAWPALVPLLIASAAAYGVSALLLRRSVLTEKIARRGYHLSREYDVDPLEVLLADEVMTSRPAVLPTTAPLPVPDAVLAATIPRPVANDDEAHQGSPASDAVERPLQRLYPVLDDQDRLAGVVTRQALVGAPSPTGHVDDLMIRDVVVVHADDTLRTVASRFAQHAITSAPVVARDDPHRLVGLVTVDHLLEGRLRDLAEEHHRERPLRPLRGRTSRRPRAGTSAGNTP